eukprot:TRINITY_DN44438_c0_g1_i1.p1 TRINITY_DN44438_c0_g1~~TRINITY_DN44438_c0_g1_i1.p1  ORF type:complete len:115 (+),score=32.95 TRINITY_DN44438_c0_g1_i1:1-345(+)
MAYGSRNRKLASGPSLLDLSNVTINDSEIDKDDALLIVSITRKAVEIAGDLRKPGVHGQIASLIKDRLEEKLSDEGWQCVVGRKGAYGSCLSPAAQQYLHFHLGQVTVILFKAN